MNNDQFRRFVNTKSSTQESNNNVAPSSTASRPSGPPVLGSRMKSSIPMTPRSIAGSSSVHKDFARQLAEKKQADQEPSQKKVRTSAPRGTKFAAGYIDRASQRTSEEEDERAGKLAALEESFKKEEIDQEEYDRLRSEIAGGDLSSTHLVKGLDFKLLERIRKGEDVYNPDGNKTTSLEQESEQEPEPAGGQQDGDAEEDIDAAFDRLEDIEVTAIQREKTVKKGQMAQPSLVPGRKRTRDQILADMKAARAAAAAAAAAEAKAKEECSQKSGFKKITEKMQPGSRVERDLKGREVLIIVDEDGHERRRVRKIAPGDEEAREKERLAMIPDKNVKPLGMQVPDAFKKPEPEPEEDDGDDIFGAAGDEYDPLAGIDEGSDSDEEEEEEEDTKKDIIGKDGESKGITTTTTMMSPPPKPSGSRNYFGDSKTKLTSQEEIKAPSMSDPAIMAALKKAASLNRTEASMAEDAETKAKEERRRKMIQNDDRDAQDLDMGFGTSRFEDQEDIDADEQDLKLATWGDEESEGGKDGGGGGGKQKRKRAPKKRKGDGNDAADVMRILEGRKAKKN